jgi:histone H3/H4
MYIVFFRSAQIKRRMMKLIPVNDLRKIHRDVLAKFTFSRVEVTIKRHASIGRWSRPNLAYAVVVGR